MRYARAILGAALSSGEVTSPEPAIWSTSRASLQAWSMNLPLNLCLMEGIEWRPTQLRSALLPLRRYLPRLSPSLLSHFGTFHNQNLNDRLGLQPVALEKLDRCPALYREQRSPPISFLSLSGCCDSSRVATASRPSTTTDPLPFKRRTVDRGVAGAEVESGSIVSPVVEVGSPDTLGPATGSVVWVSGATSWPCSCMG